MFGDRRVKVRLGGIINCLPGMSEVGNFSIHGSERILVLASAPIKEKHPDFIDLRRVTISKLFVSCVVEVHCLEGGHRVHVEFNLL